MDKNRKPDNIVSQNRKAGFNYFFENILLKETTKNYIVNS